MSKTTIASKKRVVEAIREEPRLLVAIKMLQDWLKENGYEGEDECPHLSIMRTSGRCAACRKPVMDPIILVTK